MYWHELNILDTKQSKVPENERRSGMYQVLKKIDRLDNDVRELSAKKQDKIPLSVVVTLIVAMVIQAGNSIYNNALMSSKIDFVFGTRYTSKDAAKDMALTQARFTRNESLISDLKTSTKDMHIEFRQRIRSLEKRGGALP